MEINEVMLSDLETEVRIDPELYNKQYIRRRHLLISLNHTTLKRECSVIRKGIFNVNSSNFSKVGIPFVRISNLKEMVIDSDEIVYIPQTIHTDNYKTALNSNDVILSKTAYAAASLVTLDCCNTSQDTVAIKLKSDSCLNSHYLVVYLNTKYGLEQMQRRFTGNVQMHLNLDECKNELVIPVLGQNVQDTIKYIFEVSLSKRQKAKQLYKRAEDLLLSSLGLQNWTPSNKNVSIKSFSDFVETGRLDAEFYQPKYDDIEQKIKAVGFDYLGRISTQQKSFEPGSDKYREEGTPFIRVSDLNVTGISEPAKYLDLKDFEDDLTSLMPKKDTILLSKDGSIGIAYKLDEDLEVITSGAILHLKVTDLNYLPDYVTLVLNSIVVKLQAERSSTGAIIEHWKPSEIEKVMIPKLEYGIQKQISGLVQESFALRKESKQLLEEAKRMVELEIEKGGE